MDQMLMNGLIDSMLLFQTYQKNKMKWKAWKYNRQKLCSNQFTKIKEIRYI